MQFPLNFFDVSLWLGITAIILLITSEFLSPHYGETSLLIDRKKLRNASFTVAILFLGTIAIRIYSIILQT